MSLTVWYLTEHLWQRLIRQPTSPAAVASSELCSILYMVIRTLPCRSMAAEPTNLALSVSLAATIPRAFLPASVQMVCQRGKPLAVAATLLVVDLGLPKAESRLQTLARKHSFASMQTCTPYARSRSMTARDCSQHVMFWLQTNQPRRVSNAGGHSCTSSWAHCTWLPNIKPDTGIPNSCCAKPPRHDW